MISPPELQQLLASQPLSRLQALASGLGWNGLVLRHHLIRDEELKGPHPQTQVILWYETTGDKFWLQINIHPGGQVRQYRAMVIAERYGINMTDWHDFELPEESDAVAALARTFPAWLVRDNFKSPSWRKRFLEQWPERATTMRRSKNRRGKP